jgi:hypothetical protein
MAVISVWLATAASVLWPLRGELLSIELAVQRWVSVTVSLSVTLLSVTVRVSITG